MKYWIYILTNRSNTLYVGITNDLQRRLYEHKNKLADGFSSKYNLNKLIYFEEYQDINEAIASLRMTETYLTNFDQLRPIQLDWHLGQKKLLRPACFINFIGVLQIRAWDIP